MKWNKKGVIFCADHSNEWALSHAAIPTPYLLNDRVLRIYCAFRDKSNISRIGYVDVLAENPKHILGVSAGPVLDIGQPGTFDDNGVLPISMVECKEKLYLYYDGFELGTRIPYRIFNGLAISHDGGLSFSRYQQTPIIDRSDTELFFRAAPCVIKEGNKWKMWYIAGSAWAEKNGKQLPRYAVRYLESPDGLEWGKEGHICFDPQGDEHGFGRPYVIRQAGIYKMYYSIRSLSSSYRLGCAESPDGKNWIRKDNEIGLDISPSGPDSEMICYSAVIKHRDKTYLFYNGNDYGGTGILYAELDLC